MFRSQQYCVCVWEDAGIKCELPITLPTSKVRVKRIVRRNGLEEIVPIASRKTILGENDYIEWQISYRYGNKLVEFGLMLKEFIENGYLTGDENCDILQHAESVPTFEENFKIQRDTVLDLCSQVMRYSCSK